MKIRRVLSLFMAIVTVFSALGVTAFATAAAAEPLFLEAFDGYTAATEEGVLNKTATKYTMADGFCYVRDVDAEHGNVAWLHNVYHSSFDRSPKLSYKDSTGNITASADYYINTPKDATTGEYINENLNFAIRSTGGATFESDSKKSDGTAVTVGTAPAFACIRSSGDGVYYLYLDTSKSGGWVNSNESITYVEATYVEIQPNTWFKIEIDFNLVTGLYTLTYRDADRDIILGSARPRASYQDGGLKYTAGIRNITLNANTFSMGYMLPGFQDKNWNNENSEPNKWGKTSVYMDNVQIGYTDLKPIEAANDFESYSAGETLTTNNAFTVQTHFNKVLSETVSGTDNKFLRVPFLYGGDSYNSSVTATNYDKPFILKHAAFDKTNGRYMIYESDFRFKKTAARANVQLQLSAFDFEDASGNTYNGRYLALLDINLQTGAIRGNSGNIILTGAAGLVADEWARVKLVVDLEAGAYRIYVNGVMYGYNDSMNGMYSSGGWKTVNNIKNIAVSANQFIAAKIYNSYTDAASWSHIDAADSTYFNVNHMDIDNLRLETTNTMPSIVLPPVGALEDFENGTVGGALSSANSSTTTAYNKVLSEAVSGSANKFLRIPLLYDGADDKTIATDGYTNYDKTVTLKHSKISTETGKYAVFTVDYRPHAEKNASTGTIEIQIHNYKFDALVGDGSQKSTAPRGSTFSALTENEKGLTGIYLKLFDINLATGELTGNTGNSLKKTGAKGLNLNEWNTIQFVMNLEDSSSCLFVNGALYGVSEKMQATSSSWFYYTNPSNIVFTSNCLFAAKVNKKDEAFNKLGEVADEIYSNVNYIDIDNVSLKSATEKDITVLDPVNADGDALMYVEIKGEKVANDWLYLTKDIAYEVSYFDPDEFVYDGIISTINKSSIRLKAQAGLRFATEIRDMEAFDALFALEGEEFRDVAFGTLIVPANYVSDIDFTVDALKEAGRNYLEVEASYGHYYNVDGDESTTHFVGSIVNLLPQNIARSFSAIGYIKILLWGGQEFYFYSNVSHTANVKEIAQLALNDKNMAWGAFEKSILNTYAAGGSMDATIANDMKELNVLAFGDSLFGGTIGYDQATQWVNKLGVDNNWNLTNLGIGSMTVSYTDRNNKSEYGNKNSMYDWMFNGKNDFRWGSASTHTSPNPFFKTGNISGNPDDVELIILEGGCNDYGTAISAPLGTIDSKEPGTFLGAWNCITEELLNTYKNATIVFVTTWRLNPQPRDYDTLTSIEYSESIIELYNKVYASNDRIALIDAGNPDVSGVDMLDADWRTTYSTDSYHLKDTGMKIMADHMLPLLWEIVMNAPKSK